MRPGQAFKILGPELRHCLISNDPENFARERVDESPRGKAWNALISRDFEFDEHAHRQVQLHTLAECLEDAARSAERAGVFIKTFRELTGMSQGEFGRWLGVTTTDSSRGLICGPVGAWERGESDPSSESRELLRERAEDIRGLEG